LHRLSGDLRLFDYGGNMGNVFFSCARHLEPKNVDWIVYDLPRVIEAARKLAEGRPGPKPRFSISLQDAADARVLLVSGTYHYWEKGTPEFLEQFPRLPEHVFVNRSPFYERDCEPVISMQGTLNFAFPIIIRPVGELLNGFSARGYELVDRWTAAEYRHIMPFFPDQSVARYSGFYFRRKRSTA
jgi:putative methyltransferase (TIGR04325 family)